MFRGILVIDNRERSLLILYGSNSWNFIVAEDGRDAITRGLPMTDKLEYYDILNTLVPGILLLFWVSVCFPVIMPILSPKFPEAFNILILTAVSIVLGFLIQSFADIFIAKNKRLWGGAPSDLILEGRAEHTLDKHTVRRIKEQLRAAMGDATASDDAIFYFALQHSESIGAGRASRFHSLEACHESLLALIIAGIVLFTASICWGAGNAWTISEQFILLITLFLSLIMIFLRTKDRKYYFVREVLLTAERIVTDKSTSSSTQN